MRRRCPARIRLALIVATTALAGCRPTPTAPPATVVGTDPLTAAHTMPSGFWRHAVEQMARPIAEIRAQTKAEMARGVDASKFIRGDRAKKQICFTIDDGPHPGKTEPLLEILRDENVRATFFVVGKMAEKYPHLVRAEAAAGHEIGSHTFHHVNLTKVKPDIAKTELLATDAALKAILGHGANLLRPPGGQYNASTIEIAREVGYTTVLWTDDPGDYDPKVPADLVLARTVRDASPGGIILLHDGSDSTLVMLPKLIRYLRAQGYSFLTAGELMADARATGTQPVTPDPR